MTGASASRLQVRARRARWLAERAAERDRAHRHWATGELAPYRITRALDAAGLFGPDVDRACGAEEPTVDEWEAGTRYPSFEQLLALADLTGCAPDTFLVVERDLTLDIRDTTVWGHLSAGERARWRPLITQFTDVAVHACRGTDDDTDTHLF